MISEQTQQPEHSYDLNALQKKAIYVNFQYEMKEQRSGRQNVYDIVRIANVSLLVRRDHASNEHVKYEPGHCYVFQSDYNGAHFVVYHSKRSSSRWEGLARRVGLLE